MGATQGTCKCGTGDRRQAGVSIRCCGNRGQGRGSYEESRAPTGSGRRNLAVLEGLRGVECGWRCSQGVEKARSQGRYTMLELLDCSRRCCAIRGFQARAGVSQFSAENRGAHLASTDPALAGWASSPALSLRTEPLLP